MKLRWQVVDRKDRKKVDTYRFKAAKVQESGNLKGLRSQVIILLVSMTALISPNGSTKLSSGYKFEFQTDSSQPFLKLIYSCNIILTITMYLVTSTSEFLVILSASQD